MLELYLYILTAAACAVICAGLHSWLGRKRKTSIVVVSKADMTLRCYNRRAEQTACYPVATGLNPGKKTSKGDMKTPEGVFRIAKICNSRSWSHDFHDGLGEIKDAYGPRFIRLDTPGFSGVGIHGTCKPESIATRASEGCIRMHNDDVLKFAKSVRRGTLVVISPAPEDIAADRGADGPCG